MKQSKKNNKNRPAQGTLFNPGEAVDRRILELTATKQYQEDQKKNSSLNKSQTI